MIINGVPCSRVLLCIQYGERSKQGIMTVRCWCQPPNSHRSMPTLLIRPLFYYNQHLRSSMSTLELFRVLASQMSSNCFRFPRTSHLPRGQTLPSAGFSQNGQANI